MSAYSTAAVAFEAALAHQGVRRAFAARLDMGLKRAGFTSLHVAKLLNVAAAEVQYWRAGITVPSRETCYRLSTLLHVDIAWLCLGATPGITCA